MTHLYYLGDAEHCVLCAPEHQRRPVDQPCRDSGQVKYAFLKLILGPFLFYFSILSILLLSISESFRQTRFWIIRNSKLKFLLYNAFNCVNLYYVTVIINILVLRCVWEKKNPWEKNVVGENVACLLLLISLAGWRWNKTC